MKSLQQRFKNSLRAKLTLIVVLMTTVPLILLGYFAYLNAQETVERQTITHLLSTNILKAHDFIRWLQNNQHDLRATAQRPLVREYTRLLAENAEDASAYQEAYVRLQEDHLVPTLAEGDFHSLSILLADNGYIAVSTDENIEGKYRESADFFIKGLEQTYVQEIGYSVGLQKAVMHISTPIRDETGRTIGVLSGHANLDEMSNIMMQRTGLSETEDTYLVNSFNFFVTEPMYGEDYALKRAIYTEGVENCLDGKDDVGYYADYRGVQVLGAYQWLEEYQMCLLTEVDQAEVFAPTARLRNLIVGFGLAFAGIAVLVALVFTRMTMIRPLQRLVSGTQQIGAGNLDYQLTFKRSDEIGQLAEAFNEMTTNLEQSLGDVAYSQRMLLALSQAARDVLRAHTHDEIYAAVGKGITAVGHHAIVFTADAARTKLSLAHLTFESALLQKAEKLAGLSATDFQISLDADTTPCRVFIEQEAVFCHDVAQNLAENLPRPLRPLAGKIADVLGLEEIITVPLVIEDQSVGLLEVTGAGLTEADLPAIRAFANQAAVALENARLYAEVQGYAGELENRVAERTQELEAARLAALNMMADIDEARQQAEQANRELRNEIEERRRAEEELERSNRELEQFAYVASHDLQEPLRKVQAFGDRLRHKYMDLLDERGQDYLQRMLNAAKRGQQMINDLLNFSRISTRGNPFEPTDLQSLAETTVSDLEVRIEQSDGRVEVGELPTIDADASQIRQMLVNLISNALKFHRTDVPPVVRVNGERIDAGDGRDGATCQIRVEDNGIGFDEKYLDRIFQPFQRLHGRGTYKGSGIGLAICHKIAERHGGSITAQSAPGEGATFIVTLPMRHEKDEDHA